MTYRASGRAQGNCCHGRSRLPHLGRVHRHQLRRPARVAVARAGDAFLHGARDRQATAGSGGSRCGRDRRPLRRRLQRHVRGGADGRLDRGAQARAPAVGALPLGLHPGFRSRRLRASADGGLRRRRHPGCGDARTDSGERARGPGRGRGQGQRRVARRRGAGGHRAEQPLRQLRDRQALRRARRRGPSAA